MPTVESERTSGRAEFLEREELLASLHESIAAASAASGRLIFLGGEAGVGKTTLARRFCDDCSPRTVTLWGGCDSLVTPRPLAPFLEMAETFGPLAESLAAEGGAHEVATAILAAGRLRTPLVIVLEDVHWADEATLDVMRILGRRIGTTPAVALATFRDDELGRTHPLRVLLGDLATASPTRRLRVECLSRSGVSRLAAGSDVDPEALYALTSGNPFYITELLAAGNGDIPQTVRDIVLARVAQLSPPAAAVVEAVSIAPPSLDAGLLFAVCSEAADSVDECLASGVLHSIDGEVAFRHDLARATVEDSLSPARRLALHRAVALGLADEEHGPIDLARLAYHAEAAGNRDVVLRVAPAAAEQAARVGAYREAAAQYARALRFAGDLSETRRAELLEGRSRACYLADDQVEAIAVIEEAIACRRRAGDAPKEARALSELSRYLGCRGLVTEAEQAVHEATRLVTEQPGGRELACVYAARAWLSGGARGRVEVESCLELADTAIKLAQRYDDHATALDALVTRGTAALRRDAAAGQAALEHAVALGRKWGNAEQVARALNNLGGFGAERHNHEIANTYLAAALEYCIDHDLDLWRINVLALIARSQLDQGRWTEAADTATLLLQDPRDSPWPHHEALLVLGLVRGRRGDPGARDAVDEACAVGVPADEFNAIVDLAAAAAEIAWLERRPNDVEHSTAELLAEAVERGAADAISRISYWRRITGLSVDAPAEADSPYALALAGHWIEAAAAWDQLGCPYESALALSQSDDEDALRRALEELQGLGARPAAAIVARRLRQRGARRVRRGPRPSTRENPANLTARELEVLALVAEGFRNAEIAERLFLSERTVAHHVSALLRKLDVSTRGKAGAAAARLGIDGQPQ
jgi:predicted ATPase/DNA-binding CsgD family transcriptional regulator